MHSSNPMNSSDSTNSRNDCHSRTLQRSSPLAGWAGIQRLIDPRRAEHEISGMTLSFFILLLSAFYLLSSAPSAHAELENFQAADVVLGQPDFNQGTANNGGVSARSF